MPRHAGGGWDGRSALTGTHTQVVLNCLFANRDGDNWVPLGFETCSSLDVLYLIAAQLLNICGPSPTRSEIILAVALAPAITGDVACERAQGFLRHLFVRVWAESAERAKAV